MLLFRLHEHSAMLAACLVPVRIRKGIEALVVIPNYYFVPTNGAIDSRDDHLTSMHTTSHALGTLIIFELCKSASTIADLLTTYQNLLNTATKAEGLTKLGELLDPLAHDPHVR